MIKILGKYIFLIFSLVLSINLYSSTLDFNHLSCGTYEMRGKLVSQQKKEALDYYLEIYPIRNNIQLKRTRRIKILHSKFQENILGNYLGLSIIIRAQYLKNSNKDNFIKLEKVIKATSSITVYKKENVIKKIKNSPCQG